MRKIFIALLALIGLQLSPVGEHLPVNLGVTSAFACERAATVGCNPADIITFHGDRKIPDQIKVEVCHGYWHLLDPGYYKGQLTKWWAPVMVFNTWYGDLPVVTQPCKTYWVKPGAELRLYADCVQRVISTGKMTRPGQYIMT